MTLWKHLNFVVFFVFAIFSAQQANSNFCDKALVQTKQEKLVLRELQAGAEIYPKYIDREVYVFRENKSKLWTVWGRDSQSKLKKLFWSEDVRLENAYFYVDEQKRQRVLATGKKMSHAGVWGILRSQENVTNVRNWIAVSYNPFYRPELVAQFRISETELSIHRASYVWFLKSGKVLAALNDQAVP